MPYDLYWYGDPCAARQFYKADKLKQERMNQEAWWYGRYVYDAVSIALSNSFRNKNETPIDYPKEPYKIRKSNEEGDSDNSEDKDALVAKLYMMNMCRMGKNWGKK